MNHEAKTPEEYVSQLPEERREAIEKLRKTIRKNLSEGFEEGISYKMIGFYIPHSKYPDGYHCDPKLPLPFISIASQKNSVNLYHMGIYATPALHKWFVGEYPKHCKRKLDMGKSCIRFKKMEEIPYELIGELVRKMSADDWINVYESVIKTK